MKLFTLGPEGPEKGISAVNLAEANIEPSEGMAQAYKVYPSYKLDAIELKEAENSLVFVGELNPKSREALFFIKEPLEEGQTAYLTSNLIKEEVKNGRVIRKTLPFEEGAGLEKIYENPEKGVFVVKANSGASFRICRKGPNTGRHPESTVLWTGQLGGTKGVKMYTRKNRTS